MSLLLENIHPLAVEILEGRGFEVELLTRSLSEDELVQPDPAYQAYLEQWQAEHDVEVFARSAEGVTKA